MKKTLGLLVAVALLAAIPVQAAVVFQDTFDTATFAWNDMSPDLAARQAGGAVGSTYSIYGDLGTAGTALGEAPFAGMTGFVDLRQTGNSAPADLLVHLDTDFGSQLAGNEWTVSMSANLGWIDPHQGAIALSVGSGVANFYTGGFALAIEAINSPTASLGVYSQGSLIGGMTVQMASTLDFVMNVTVDETAGTARVYYENAWGTISDQTFSGVAFADGVRNFELTHHRDVGAMLADWRIEDLQIDVVPEPATASLIGLVGGGLLWFRKRFHI